MVTLIADKIINLMCISFFFTQVLLFATEFSRKDLFFVPDGGARTANLLQDVTTRVIINFLGVLQSLLFKESLCALNLRSIRAVNFLFSLIYYTKRECFHTLERALPRVFLGTLESSVISFLC